MRKCLCCLVFVILAGCVRDMGEIRGLGVVPLRLGGEDRTGTWRSEGNAIVGGEPGNVEAFGRFQESPGRDLEVSCRLTRERNAVGGVLFRAAVAEDALVSGYVLRVHAQGVDLWRMEEGAVVPLQRYVRSLGPEGAHGLRLRVEGDKIAVELDGEPLFTARDRTPLLGGEAGLYAFGGTCRFESVAVERL
jgi:hypothetical protein